jgi:hypothetical protein
MQLRAGQIHMRRGWECRQVSYILLVRRRFSQPLFFPDIGEFLTEEIKGPAQFSCKSGRDCKFEEPAMNDLIDSIFGDAYISLICGGGECLHYSQVPGYVVCAIPRGCNVFF